MIWKRVGESFCSVCLDVEIHNTGGGSIPQTLTWFLRSPAYVSPEYSALQAGSTLSLPLPSSLFVSSSLEVLAIFLWRTGPFITATGFWLLYCRPPNSCQDLNWYTPGSPCLRSGCCSLWVPVMISALLKMIVGFTDQLERAHKKTIFKSRDPILRFERSRHATHH